MRKNTNSMLELGCLQFTPQSRKRDWGLALDEWMDVGWLFSSVGSEMHSSLCKRYSRWILLRETTRVAYRFWKCIINAVLSLDISLYILLTLISVVLIFLLFHLFPYFLFFRDSNLRPCYILLLLIIFFVPLIFLASSCLYCNSSAHIIQFKFKHCNCTSYLSISIHEKC
jgi:hypothetical protein